MTTMQLAATAPAAEAARPEAARAKATSGPRTLVERAKAQPVLTAIKLGALGVMTLAPVALIVSTISAETPGVILSMTADLLAAIAVVWFYLGGVFFDDEDEDHRH